MCMLFVEKLISILHGDWEINIYLISYLQWKISVSILPYISIQYMDNVKTKIQKLIKLVKNKVDLLV